MSGSNREIACFPRYGPQGASSRLRTYQYVASLNAAGFNVTAHPLLSDTYVNAFNIGRREWREITTGYFRRFGKRAIVDHADLLFVEKELFPWLPMAAESMVLPPNKPLVLDFDDAIFHNYDLGSFLARISPLRNKIDRLMRRASVITAGSGYLMERAELAGAARVEFLPTVVDPNRYPVRNKADCGELIIGWIGSPTTEKYLRTIDTVLSNVCRKFGARVVLIGARPAAANYQFPVTVQPWSEATEGDDISAFDVGVMPLSDGPWERGKCGYKLIQYMACARPVVASPVGANLAIVQHGVQGFLARDDAAWERCLGDLLASASLRAEMGAAGRQRVLDEYSLARGSETLIRIFNSV